MALAHGDRTWNIYVYAAATRTYGTGAVGGWRLPLHRLMDIVKADVEKIATAMYTLLSTAEWLLAESRWCAEQAANRGVPRWVYLPFPWQVPVSS